MKQRGDKPKSFAARAKLRAWLARNHASAAELNLRLFKVHASKRGVTYREALDEALCFGWIDGVRRSYDADSFTQRFTPRRQGSKWSQVNLRRMRELQAAGLVAAPGLAAWRAAPRKPTGYSSESKPVPLRRSYVAQLTANSQAHSYYQRQAPWYRRVTTHWVMSAKQEETRQRRLERLIACCAQERAISPELERKTSRKKTA
ncbi:MAG TPA: YdeI/OmpD-associated family protein [Steroidobacteraceae bacterium]|nr:YdeI/OmpD-associated family protein [Steroidobacteraceae bacterium]